MEEETEEKPFHRIAVHQIRSARSVAFVTVIAEIIILIVVIVLLALREVMWAKLIRIYSFFVIGLALIYIIGILFSSTLVPGIRWTAGIVLLFLLGAMVVFIREAVRITKGTKKYGKTQHTWFIFGTIAGVLGTFLAAIWRFQPKFLVLLFYSREDREAIQTFQKKDKYFRSKGTAVTEQHSLILTSPVKKQQVLQLVESVELRNPDRDFYDSVEEENKIDDDDCIINTQLYKHWGTPVQPFGIDCDATLDDVVEAFIDNLTEHLREDVAKKFRQMTTDKWQKENEYELKFVLKSGRNQVTIDTFERKKNRPISEYWDTNDIKEFEMTILRFTDWKNFMKMMKTPKKKVVAQNV